MKGFHGSDRNFVQQTQGPHGFHGSGTVAGGGIHVQSSRFGRSSGSRSFFQVPHTIFVCLCLFLSPNLCSALALNLSSRPRLAPRDHSLPPLCIGLYWFLIWMLYGPKSKPNRIRVCIGVLDEIPPCQPPWPVRLGLCPASIASSGGLARRRFLLLSFASSYLPVGFPALKLPKTFRNFFASTLNHLVLPSQHLQASTAFYKLLQGISVRQSATNRSQSVKSSHSTQLDSNSTHSTIKQCVGRSGVSSIRPARRPFQAAAADPRKHGNALPSPLLNPHSQLSTSVPLSPSDQSHQFAPNRACSRINQSHSPRSPRCLVPISLWPSGSDLFAISFTAFNRRCNGRCRRCRKGRKGWYGRCRRWPEGSVKLP